MYFVRLFAVFSVTCAALYGDNLLHPGDPVADRPTLTALGVQLPLTGDDNFNASVTMDYRVAGTQDWHSALPLFRVHPETVAGYLVSPRFSGSIFDLRPATTYEIRLHAVDPDGLDRTWTTAQTTRAVPTDPVNPRARRVTDPASLASAVASAAPGDVITLANGFYPGAFRVIGEGTPLNPIVIRGESEDGVIVDAGNCPYCNVFEIYGAGYVHLERMTIQNGQRAIRFQTGGATGNVVRQVHIRDTTLGVGGQAGQFDFYIADNILEGRLRWPQTYFDDNGAHANDDGIAVSGSGHVVAHNRISGFGDAMKTLQDGARANDFYDNQILYTYDNGLELDDSEGNTRALRNLFLNCFSPLSVQPIHGGPSYIVRNVVVNVVNEQLKFHALAVSPPQEPSGVLVYNNTFLSPAGPELNLQTPAVSHYFEIENNLFIAAPGAGGFVVDWTGAIDHGVFDYNGYFPDGIFRFNNPLLGGLVRFQNFAALKSAGMEQHGMLVGGPLFATGLVPPALYTQLVSTADVTLAAGSAALDVARLLPNVNDNYQGKGPDLGALELGCPVPLYGPRPAGVDESNEVVGCGIAPAPPPSPIVYTGVSITPAQITLANSQSLQFTATTTPSGGSVTWSVTPARGSLSPSGLYTAPADAMLGETVTVRAVSTTNAAVGGSASITLKAPVGVSVTPALVSMGTGGTQQFTATVTGALNKSVSWTLNPAIGSITAGGLYTGPVTPNGEKVSVTATSNAEPSQSATATLVLPVPAPPPPPPPPPGPISVTITPGYATLGAGATLQFYAAVANTNNTSVIWRVSPGGGTITPGGLYQAPGIVRRAMTVTISAQSAADPRAVAIASLVILR